MKNNKPKAPPPAAAHTTARVLALPCCDFCSLDGAQVPAYADARIPGRGSWAYLCRRHFYALGCSLGLGAGQRLLVLPREAKPKKD